MNEHDLMMIVQQLMLQMDRLEGKVDALFALRQAQQPAERSEGRRVLGQLTVKQHAVAQMMVLGIVDRVIGERMGITRNTAKLHRGAIMHKLGVTKHNEAVRRLAVLMEAVDPIEYATLSGGLPRNWAATYVEPDPYKPLYHKDK
ncbi:Transcription regulator LuxR, C-terminal [uncultured Caudovirales phage]|uniref:Transcription regulator LuxR, C-terminal n=1 Tax=uncultured Caudovirales phage TaxID=2100421 RepID=A0A6J5NHW1_9CAUD|nr:Transcription regulator LuxR, C-terminal [uncultured Caudovirales phage]